MVRKSVLILVILIIETYFLCVFIEQYCIVILYAGCIPLISILRFDNLSRSFKFAQKIYFNFFANFQPYIYLLIITTRVWIFGCGTRNLFLIYMSNFTGIG